METLVVIDLEAAHPWNRVLGQYWGIDEEGLVVIYFATDGSRREAPADCVEVRALAEPASLASCDHTSHVEGCKSCTEAIVPSTTTDGFRTV